MGIAYCKRGDTAIQFTNPREVAATATTPAIEHEPLMVRGSVVNLTGATIKFLLKMLDSPYTQYSFDAEIDGDPEDGDVLYTRGEGFPTTLGKYKQEWEITQSDGSLLTFPQQGHNILVIEEDLNTDTYTIVVTDTNLEPIEGCHCWLTNDEAGTDIEVPSRLTNNAGEVEFSVSAGTYWLFRQKQGISFTTNPKEVTIA